MVDSGDVGVLILHQVINHLRKLYKLLSVHFLVSRSVFFFAHVFFSGLLKLWEVSVDILLPARKDVVVAPI